MAEWKYKSPGIPDDYFIRGEVPMTKSELRAVIISKLRLKNKQIAYDIGAGSGSISVEMGLALKSGQVYALERKAEALNLIKKNIENFKLNNIQLIKSEAPLKMEALPEADRIFIGGSGGHLAEIIEQDDQKLKKRGRIVLTAVTLNTLTIAVAKLESLNYKLEIVNVAVTRTRNIKNYKMFKALTPIYVISAQREE
jgi:precorrin-6Y C5,15-methyltransferase (decarboxylating) CbiT subunit